MENYIAPFALLIVLFVGFGLIHRNGQNSRGGCAGCSGSSCSGSNECSNGGKASHH
jgi:hypothetical protein